jgi:hypothetical protein
MMHPGGGYHVPHTAWDLYQKASIDLGTLTTMDGTLYPECRLLTGAPRGLIFINGDGIFELTDAELDDPSREKVLRLVHP